ncbi:MAG TPA: hypothetical protein VNS19_14745 [Acidimicrobiales bacterium]|nr:hypothetical protein [Acidimicrobiales bacterium]
MSSKTNSFEPRRSLRRRRAALVGLVAPLAFVAACGSGGSEADSTTTAAPTTTEATTTTEVSADEAGEAFQDLVEDADDAIADEQADRDAFAAENDVDGAVESAAGLQADIEDFQAELAHLEVPTDAQDAIDELDDVTTDYVDALAGYEDVAEVSEYNDQLDEERDAESAWRDAVAEAADVLGVDGLSGDDERDDSGSSSGVSEADSDDESASSGPITGDGSEYCLQDGDLPAGFLPLTGDDNASNALTYTFDEGPEADYADALVASWMVLPEGGAQETDLTADCMIHIFDSAESAEGFYDVWTSDYGANSFPTPEPADLPDGAPGEDPLAFTKDVGGRPNAEQVFRYENVVVSVGISGTPANDSDSVLLATNDLATLVFERLEAAA